MRITSLTAAEIMSSDVVQVAPTASLSDAMQQMVARHVGSLPVVDELERCVGIITKRDILDAALNQEQGGEELDAKGSFYNPDSDAWESIAVCVALDDLPDRPVREVMADHVVFVHPSTGITEVAEAMVEEGLHHVLVIDDERRLLGVISSMDFVRLALQAGDGE